MTGRLRYVLAAAFVALFFLVPDADREQIGYLQTRAWLMGDEGPLAQSLADGKIPRLEAEVLTPAADVGGVSAAERRAKWSENLQRVSREWARRERHDVDPGLPPIRLSLRVGDSGHRSEALVPGKGTLRHEAIDATANPTAALPADAPYYPDRYSLLPAFLAIILAILTAKVIPSLLLGCFAGAWLYRPDLRSASDHLFQDTIWRDVLTDTFSIEIMGFVIFLFMSVGIMSRAGGLQGMVELIRRYAKGPVSSQLCSYAIGILIFFDDYSNCIITGTTMRPLTDRNRVSREKLAYIVDSTAAPIAGISIFSTWVAYEVSMFAPQLPEVTKADGSPYTQQEGFTVFIDTLPLRFYCLFTLVMVLMTILFRREFGPMLHAENRAVDEGKPYADDAKPMVSANFEKLEPAPGTRCLARNALIPIGSLVVITLSLIFWFGYQSAVAAGDDLNVPLFDQIKIFLQRTESQKALFWASLHALLLASGLALGDLARNLRILLLAFALVTAVQILRFGVAGAAAAGVDLDVTFTERLSLYLEHTDTSRALIWGAVETAILAIAMSLGSRILTLGEVLVNAWRSITSLGFAVVILILAWTIGNICGDLGTSQFLTAAFGDSFSPWMLPSVLFLISSLVAFSTGTSYGTMAILLPNVVVLAHTVGASPESIGGAAMMMLTIGAVLEGSIFGDHCSPISDTTVLSSVATGSDHLHHVRTQAPYAVFVMLVSMLAGYIPMAVFGPDYWIVSWIAGIGILAAWMFLVGRRPGRDASASAA